MGPRWLGTLFLPLLLGVAAAADEVVPPVPGNPLQDFAVYIIVGFIALCLFVILVARLFKGSDEQLSRFFVLKALGGAFGVVCIVVGSIFFIAAILVLITLTGITDIFEWVLYELTPLFDGILQITDPVVSLLPVGLSQRTLILLFLLIGGVLLFVIGLYLLISTRSGMFYTRKGTPTRSRFTTFREVMTRGTEPLNPTVTFRVVAKDTGEPAPDVKVMLREKEGGRVYQKYTDFNGEVAFQKIQGTYSTYYAFVEGDEDRSRYRVIRTSVGAGTDTE
jgi:hypothetical protein